MLAGSALGLVLTAFGVVLSDGRFSRALEHMMEEAEEAELQVSLVDVLL
jgi:hypothetical protein